MVRRCVRDGKQRAVSKWLASVHMGEPYTCNKLLIAFCTLHLVYLQVSEVEHLESAIMLNKDISHILQVNCN